MFDPIRKALDDQSLPISHRQALTSCYVEIVQLSRQLESARLREGTQTAIAALYRTQNDHLRIIQAFFENRDVQWRSHSDSLKTDVQTLQGQISQLQQQLTTSMGERDTLAVQVQEADKYTKSVIDRYQTQDASLKKQLELLSDALGPCSCCQTDLGLCSLMSCPHRVCHTCKPQLTTCPICRCPTQNTQL